MLLLLLRQLLEQVAPPPPPPPTEPPAEQPQAQPVSQPIAPRRSSSRKRVGLWVDGRPVWVDPGQVVEHPGVTKARARRKRQMAQLLRLH